MLGQIYRGDEWVGEVELGPYRYEFRPDDETAEQILENGPRETVRMGGKPPEGAGEEALVDDSREASPEEKIKSLDDALFPLGYLVLQGSPADHDVTKETPDDTQEKIAETAASVVSGVVKSSSTPEGVPDDARYVTPEEAEELDDGNVVQSDSGGHYVVSEGDESESEDTERHVPDAFIEEIERIKEERGDLLARMDIADLVEDETGLDRCSFGGWDVEQGEEAAKELVALEQGGHLENVRSFSSGISEGTKERHNIADGEEPSGAFDSYDNSVQIRTDRFEDDFQEQMMDGDAEFDDSVTPLAGDEKTHMIRHEVSHSIDLMTVDKETRLEKCKAGWEDIGVDEEQKNEIGLGFSLCSALNPSELAAEVLAMKLGGNTSAIPEEVKEVYNEYVEQYGGEPL